MFGLDLFDILSVKEDTTFLYTDHDFLKVNIHNFHCTGFIRNYHAIHNFLGEDASNFDMFPGGDVETKK
jgi:hypothetical protein